MLLEGDALAISVNSRLNFSLIVDNPAFLNLTKPQIKLKT